MAEKPATALSMPVYAVRRELRLAQAWRSKEIVENGEAGPFRQSEDGRRLEYLTQLSRIMLRNSPLGCGWTDDRAHR
jgi:hypothetical protein